MAQSFHFCFLFVRCNKVKRYVVTIYKCLKKQACRYSDHMMHSFLLPFKIGGLWKLRFSAADICNERLEDVCLIGIYRYIPVLCLSPIPTALVTPGLVVDVIHQACGDAELPPGSGGRRSLECLSMALCLVSPPLRSDNANF